jgi:hypothetical protein
MGTPHFSNRDRIRLMTRQPTRIKTHVQGTAGDGRIKALPTEDNRNRRTARALRGAAETIDAPFSETGAAARRTRKRGLILRFELVS